MCFSIHNYGPTSIYFDLLNDMPHFMYTVEQQNKMSDKFLCSLCIHILLFLAETVSVTMIEGLISLYLTGEE